MNQLLNDFQHPRMLPLTGRGSSQAPVAQSDGQRQRRRWSPYEVNGGTVAAIVAEDKIVMACDSR